MSPGNDIPGGQEPTASSGDSDASIARWSDDPGGLSQEECARLGIEAAAGLVIAQDVFGTNSHPDAHFCACAEMRHVVTGSGDALDDHIAVSFRVVEIRDGTYPLVGEESVRMIMQPLCGGNVSAHWGPVGGGTAGRSLDGPGLSVADLEGRSGICRPMTLGDIPEQDDGDFAQPSFLFLKDPGAGWQIWRRFAPAAADGLPMVEDGYRTEGYTMVYPMLSPHMNWRFRVYDLADGRIRWQVDSHNR